MRCAATIDVPLMKPDDREDDRDEDRVRRRRAGERDRAEAADRDRVDDAEQLIAEHLHGNRKRKAPERGAYSGVIDDHRGRVQRRCVSVAKRVERR